MTTPNKIAVTCPSCGFKLRAPADKAGKKGKCPKCGAGIVIPFPEPEPIAEELPFADEPEPVPQPSGASRPFTADDQAVADKWNDEVRRLKKRQKQGPRRKSRRGLWIVLVLLLLAAVGGGGAAVYFLVIDAETPKGDGGTPTAAVEAPKIGGPAPPLQYESKFPTSGMTDRRIIGYRDAAKGEDLPLVERATEHKHDGKVLGTSTHLIDRVKCRDGNEYTLYIKNGKINAISKHLSADKEQLLWVDSE